MKDNVKISIIIPTYNRAASIGKTIDTFVGQDYDDWEMYVVDDMSQDDTREVIERYAQRDCRIHYLLNERKKGAQGARNTGLLHSDSEYVVIFDSDDYVYPNFLSTLLSSVDDNTDVVTCYARRINVNDNSENVEHWGGEGNIECGLMTGELYVNFDNCLFRKSKLIEIGLLDEDCPAYQEWDTHIRLSRICNYKQIKRVLMDYMWGGGDTMSVNQYNNLRGRCYVLWHNRKRWRKVAYESFIGEIKSHFRRGDLKIKKQLICTAPEVILHIPSIYLNAVKKYVKRKIRK